MFGILSGLVWPVCVYAIMISGANQNKLVGDTRFVRFFATHRVDEIIDNVIDYVNDKEKNE